jgi:hypothetical protein
MRKGQNLAVVMLACVFVIGLTTIFMLSGMTASVNSSLEEAHEQAAAASTVDVTGHKTPDLLVNSVTGNVAAGSAIPCCANAAAGCAEGIANCTYINGAAGLSCPSKAFDRTDGRCA